MTDSAEFAAEPKPSPITRGLLLADVPGEGRHMSIRASEAELSELADFAEVEAVTGFFAEVLVKPWGKNGFQVTGKVSANVVQTCVVSLDPVENRVEEAILLKLVPVSEAERYEAAAAALAEGVLDPAADDLPDFFDGPAIDVGSIAVEFFALGLDPYPRKPGVEFQPLPDPDAEALRPFAKLAALKKPE